MSVAQPIPETYLPKPRDDSGAALRDLLAGRRLSFLIAPAAPRRIRGFGRLLGFLRDAGAVSFHEVLPYADVSVWLYWRELSSGTKAPLIVSACAGAAAAARAMSRPLLPIPSPLQAAAMIEGRRLRQAGPDRGPEAFAFISPCAFKWTEFESIGPGGAPVEYNVTIRGLNAMLESGRVSTKAKSPAKARRAWSPYTVGAFGSVLASLRAVMPGLDGSVVLGLGRALDAMSRERAEGEALLEPYSCAGGCERGSAVDPVGNWAKAAVSAKAKAPPSRDELLARFSSFERRFDPLSLAITNA